MGFTRDQQVKVYRPMVKRAWAAYSRSQGIHPKDKIAWNAWYRATLHEGVGVYSTCQCNPGADFENAMAAFEAVIGDSIYWQLKAAGGPLKRTRHALDQLMREHYIEEDYVSGVSRQMFDTSHHNLDAKKLAKLIAALKTHLHRHEPESVGVDVPF